MLKVGDVLVGRYEIKALLGEGGMGAVFRAFDTQLERFVAIKEFRLGDLPSEDDTPIKGKGHKPLTLEAALKLFRKEAKLLASLDHVNLPKIFDIIFGSEAYIVMTLIEGISLADLLEKNRSPLLEEQVNGWLHRVLEALQYCHDNGVIHRDLKPENLLLTPDDQIFLIDFGISKRLNTGQILTITGATLGTPGYAPPEQYSMKGANDPRSDLYSLGATAYTLLTNKIPTEANDRAAGEILPNPRKLNPAISIQMEKFILNCLEIRKEDRPQSAHEAKGLLPPPQRKSNPLVVLFNRVLPDIKHLSRKKTLVSIVSGALLGLLFWIAGWIIGPTIFEPPPETQKPSTAIVATTQSATLTQTQIAWLATIAAAKSDTPTITPIPTKTHTPTFTLTPTSTLIPPECSEIGQEWVSPVDGMTLLCVPDGSFTMGSDEYSKAEAPEHLVYLDAFWIDQTEVTNSQYSECVADGDCSAPPSSDYDDPDYKDHPVVNVTWTDAEKYCTWAGRTLPTEAQWEKAARGNAGRIYPWGNLFACPKANGGDSSCDNTSSTTSVGIFLAGSSPYGALDMAGNVYEWVADWYDEKYYHTYQVNHWPDNPTGPKSGDFRVLRGGSWHDNSYYLRSSYRYWLYDTDRYNFVGFRCAKNTSP